MSVANPPVLQTKRLLLVAHDSWQAQCVELLLADHEFSVRRVEPRADFAEQLQAERYDVLLWDLASGAVPAELQETLSKGAPELPLVMLASAEEEDQAVRAVARGADSYLLEDQFGAGALVRELRHVIERRQALVRHGADERELQKQLACQRRQRGRLESSWGALQGWLAGLTHELRSPLTVVQEYCSIMRDGLAGTISGEQKRYLDIIADQVSHLDATLNNFVACAQLASGERFLRRKSTRVIDLVERLKPAWDAKAELRRIRCDAQVSCELPRVYCDPTLVERALSNLVGLAVRRSPEGGAVCVRARYEPEHGQVRIVICDSGRVSDQGEPASRPNLTASAAASPAPEQDSFAPWTGVSFVLSATRALVAANLGELQGTEAPSAGTNYSFTLPVIDPEAVATSYLRFIKHRATEPRSVAHILVSLDLDAGEDAAEQLDALLAQQIGPDDLALRVERFVWVLIVNVTTEEAPALIARLHDAWQKSHRERGAAPDVLIEARAMYHIEAPASQPLEPAVDAVPSAPRERPRLLLVDDEAAIVQALQLRLTAAGYEVFTAHDGAQGLVEMKQRRPDLVLLDIRMPVMNGLAMLKRVRDDETLRPIPVIMLSASHDDRKQALELGARFFLEKPYDPNILKMTVAGALEQRAAATAS